MHNIEINGKPILLPSHRGELSRRQLLPYLQTVFSGLSRDEMIGFFLHAICRGEKNKAIHDLNDVQYLQVAALLDWVVEPWPPEFFPQRISVGLRTYHAPKKQLMACPLMQYVLADGYFSQLEKKTESLPYLVAALYLPSPQIGKPYSTLTFDKRATAIADHVGSLVQLSVMLSFAAVKSWLIEKYELVFSGGANGSNQGTNPWADTIFSIAETGVFGGVEQVKQVPVNEIFAFLEKKERERLHHAAQSR
jgi:hypothetical protein